MRTRYFDFTSLQIPWEQQLDLGAPTSCSDTVTIFTVLKFISSDASKSLLISLPKHEFS